MEVACALDHLVLEREKEKWGKYQELAADLVKQWQGFMAVVVLGIWGG